MKNIRSFVNQHATAFLMLILGVVILFSFGCGPVDEEDVEQLLQPDETDEATPSVGMDTEVTVEEPVGLETLTFTIDATNREAWAYFSFATGDVVEVVDAENSDAWDIGFQRTQVKLNGGISGPGMGSAVMLTETTFEAVTAAPADGYREDTEDTLAIVPQSEKGWYIYTGPPDTLDSPFRRSRVCNKSCRWNVRQSPICRILQRQREQARQWFCDLRVRPSAGRKC